MPKNWSIAYDEIFFFFSLLFMLFFPHMKFNVGLFLEPQTHACDMLNEKLLKKNAANCFLKI